MTTTYTDYTDSENGAQSIVRLGGEVVMDEIDIDFSSFNVGAGDIVQLFNVSKNDVLLSAITQVYTAEGDTATGDIGITTTDPNGLDDAVNLNSVACSASSVGTDALIGYKMTQDDTIDLVTDHALDAAKVSFRLLKIAANPNPASDSLA